MIIIKDFWLNVYRDGFMDFVAHLSKESADKPFLRPFIAYRIHVRMK